MLRFPHVFRAPLVFRALLVLRAPRVFRASARVFGAPLIAQVSLLVLGLALTHGATAQCNGPDDGLEDNDTCATALAVSMPFVRPNLWVHRHDPDLFRVTVPNGRELRAFVQFDDSLGDIDLVLYDAGAACGDLWVNVRSSRSNNNDELIVWQNTSGAPRTLVVQVEMWRGSIPECNDYNLSLTADPPYVGCQPNQFDDGLEDNDSCASACALPLGHTPGLWASREDEDFYACTVPAGGTLDVALQFNHGATDIDLFLFDAAAPCGGGFGTGELARSYSETNDEQLVWVNSSASPRNVIVHVDVFYAHSCNTYSMTASISGNGLGTNYCSATSNVTGLSGRISARGSNLVAANDVVLEASQLPPFTAGAFICSRESGWQPGIGGTIGVLCLSGELGRYDSMVLPTGPNGRMELRIDLTRVPRVAGTASVLANETWYFQAWYRDRLNNQATSNLSDGLAVTFQ